MRSLQSRGMLLGLSALFFVAVGAPARSEEKAPLKSAGRSERVSGVILKVEPIKKGADSGSSSAKEAKPVTQRLTINTAAVWRDWARDQTGTADQSARADAAKGANSVATKGEPADKDTTAVVDLGPDSVVMTRFRARDDESSKGAKSNDAKAPEFKRSDLKPGLFVEIDYRHASAQNVATTIAVIRPLAAPKGASDGK